jgi:hypothetical protein
MTAPPIADTSTATSPLSPPLGERPVRGPSTNSGVVVFAQETDRDQYDGRNAVRRAVLSMPSDGTDRVRRPRLAADHGVFWGLAGANGLTVVLSVEDYSTIDEAVSDAEHRLARLDQMVFHPRRANASRIAFWITLDGEVVMVSGGTFKGVNGERRLRRALREAWLPAADADHIEF